MLQHTCVACGAAARTALAPSPRFGYRHQLFKGGRTHSRMRRLAHAAAHADDSRSVSAGTVSGAIARRHQGVHLCRRDSRCSSAAHKAPAAEAVTARPRPGSRRPRGLRSEVTGVPPRAAHTGAAHCRLRTCACRAAGGVRVMQGERIDWREFLDSGVLIQKTYRASTHMRRHLTVCRRSARKVS
jgi:hypothetical protein